MSQTEVSTPSDEQLRSILHVVDTPVITLDASGQIVQFNRACERLSGYSADEVKGKPFWTLFRSPEDHDMRDVFGRALRGEQVEHKSYLLAADNKHIVYWSSQTVTDRSGTPEFVVMTGITERINRLELEEKLTRRLDELTQTYEQLSLLERAIDAANTFIADMRQDGAPLVYVKQHLVDATDYERNENDINEQIREWQRNRHWRQPFDALFTFMGVLTPGGTVLDINQASLDTTGRERDDIVFRTFDALSLWSSDDDRQRLRQAIDRAAQGQRDRFEIALDVGDETLRLDMQIVPVFHPISAWQANQPDTARSGAPRGHNVERSNVVRDDSTHAAKEDNLDPTSTRAAELVVCAIDITAQRRAEAERDRLSSQLEGERNRLYEIFSGLPAAVAIFEGAEHIGSFANPTFQRLFGVDVIGKRFHEVSPSHDGGETLRYLERTYQQVKMHQMVETELLVDRGVGGLELGYFNVIYQPLVSPHGAVLGVVYTAFDVTKQVIARQSAQDARRLAEMQAAEMNAILQSIPDALYVGTAAGITKANKPALDMLGFDSLEALNRNVEILNRELDNRFADTGERVPPDQEPFARAFGGETVVYDILTRHLKTGKDLVVRCAAAPIRIGDDVVGAVAVNTDITEQKRVQRELQESQAQLQAILEHIPAGVIVSRWPNGELIYINPQVAEILGHPTSRSSAVGAYQEEWHGYHYDGRRYQSDEYPLARSLRFQEYVQDEEFLYHHPDTEPVHLRVSSAPIIDSQDRQLGAVLALFDITKQKKAEIALAARANKQRVVAQIGQRALQRQNLQTFLQDTTRDIALALDADHCKVLRLRAEHNDLLLVAGVGWQPGIVGHAVIPLSEDSQARFTLEQRDPVVVSDLRTETRFRGPPLLDHHKIVSGISVVIGSGDTVYGVLGIHSRQARNFGETDVDFVRSVANIIAETIRRDQSERALADARVNLENRVAARTRELSEINAELEAFTYSVSHDLRAPLRSIDGFSQALVEDFSDDLAPSAKHYLSRIRNATQRMGQLIDDLLALSRVSKRTMNPNRVDLSEIARSIVFELRQRQPGHEVYVDIAPDMVVTGDSHLLDIALHNLFENAWKFTQQTPNPRIAFGQTKRLALGGKLVAPPHDAPSAYPLPPVSFTPPVWRQHRIYYVTDNGAGFDMAYANKLFQPFSRLHSNSEFEGTGVGLVIVQRIIHRHGGRIWGHGSVGEGASFYFTLAQPLEDQHGLTPIEANDAARAAERRKN